LLIAPVLAIIPFPRTTQATGFESPLRWTEQSEKPQVLNPPEFFFELEVKRLAAELKPVAKAVVPESDTAKQTADADLSDFLAALEEKVIRPLDVNNATAVHQEMRELLGTIVRVDQAAIDAMMPEDLIKPLKAPREAIDEPPALNEFDSEFADYHRGALSFRCGHFEKAVDHWKSLLARPAAERRYRTTWALFMLGKSAIEAEKWDEAIDWFIKTREAAAGGFVDSLGLASASLGWQAFACEESGRLADAARLYLDQLASGDTSAILSLRYLMRRVFVENADLVALARDPVLQRIGTAGAVCDISPFSPLYSDDQKENDLATRWLAALEEAKLKSVRDADRVGWIAYSRGQYSKAARWLERADPDAPFSLWLKAKFALRDGKVDAAARLLGQAIEKLRPSDMLVSRSLYSINEMPPENAARGDMGMLRLSRGEFVAAVRTFLDAGRFEDAFYVADSVLTTEELKRFVDNEIGPWEKAHTVRKPPVPADAVVPGKTGELPEPRDTLQVGWQEVWQHPGSEFRSILASRYIRSERFAAARPYLNEEAQGWLDEYVAAVNRARESKASKSERAAALWDAAKIMRDHGSYLAQFYDPISIAARLSGRVVETGPIPIIAIKYKGQDKFVPPVSKSEKERLKMHPAQTIRRYYYIYLAADLGWQAAALLPDNDEQTARILNTAGSWLKAKDDDAADRFYQAIERRCPKTEIGREAVKRHWFVPVEEEAEKTN
jgi:tetratricopeptide (TPR) repeat protein